MNFAKSQCQQDISLLDFPQRLGSYCLWFAKLQYNHSLKQLNLSQAYVFRNVATLKYIFADTVTIIYITHF